MEMKLFNYPWPVHSRAFTVETKWAGGRVRIRCVGVFVIFLAVLVFAEVAAAAENSLDVSVVSVSAWHSKDAPPQFSIMPQPVPTIVQNGHDVKKSVSEFLQVALGRECSAHAKIGPPSVCEGELIRWTESINYYVYGASSKESLLIDATLESLAAQSGLPIERVAHKQQASMRIFFYDVGQRKKFLALLEDVADEYKFSQSYRMEVGRRFVDDEQLPCFAFLSSDQSGDLSRAAIYIHAGLEDRGAERCVSLALLQAMGLPKNRVDVPDSMLGMDNSLTRPTESDEEFVRLLYGNEVREGMGRPEVVNALRKNH